MFCAVVSALFIACLLMLVVGAMFAKSPGSSSNGGNQHIEFSLATIISHPDLILFYVWVGTVFLGGWLIFVTGIVTSSLYLKKMKQMRLPLKLATIMLATNITGLLAVPASFVIMLIGYALTCTGSC